MIYLDNAATTYPKPPAVREALLRSLSEYGGNPGRGGHRLSIAAADAVYDCRRAVADFFGIDEPERVIFTAGATAALNLAIKTAVRPGMHVLLSDREHNAVARPIYRLADEGLIEYDIYPTTGDVIADIEAHIRPNTGLLVACHLSNVTGFVLPIEAIGEMCRAKGIRFVIDAAGSAGHLPIDLGSTAFDAFCAPGHKGLLGISGVGFVILKNDEGLSDYTDGGSGHSSLSRRMPSTLPERYEAGTLPTPAIVALRAGIETLCHRDPLRIAAEEAAMKARLTEGLLAHRGLTVYEPRNPYGPLLFTHESLRPEAIAEALDRHGVCVRAGYHCAPLAHRTVGTPTGGGVRLSPAITNRPAEIEEFLRILKAVLREESK